MALIKVLEVYKTVDLLTSSLQRSRRLRRLRGLQICRPAYHQPTAHMLQPVVLEVYKSVDLLTLSSDRKKYDATS